MSSNVAIAASPMSWCGPLSSFAAYAQRYLAQTIRDGNSPLVTACLYELARHPDIQKEAREEVLRLGGEKVNYDQLKSMRFLRAVIDEALRLYPSGASVPRPTVCFADHPAQHPSTLGVRSPCLFDPLKDADTHVDCLEDNSCVASDGHRYCFAAGTEVTINVYALQRRKDLWGNDADKFRPSRWSEEGIPAHNAFMPFGLTPRKCVLGPCLRRSRWLDARTAVWDETTSTLSFCSSSRPCCDASDRSRLSLSRTLHLLPSLASCSTGSTVPFCAL